MIQFFGLHLGRTAATCKVLGRDLNDWAESSSALLNVAEDGEALAVPAAEWLRSGCFAMQEAYFALPVSARKPWGAALTGAAGWVGLDFEFQPLTAIRLMEADRVPEDIRRFREASPREARRMRMVLTPKDYFRFVVSGTLATDVTEADRLGWLKTGTTRYHENSLAAAALDRAAVPPIFESSVAVGTLSEDGIRRTSLPRGMWVVAGAHEADAAWLASVDVAAGRCAWRGDGDESLLACGVKSEATVDLPPGWVRRRGPVEGVDIVERHASSVPPSEAELGEAGVIAEGTGEPVEARGSAATGAALLAVVASGLMKRWREYYRREG